MSSTRRTSMILLALVGVLSGMLSGTSSASEDGPAEAYARMVQSGRLSEADREILLRSPEIARTVVDPGRTTVEQHVRPADGNEPGAQAGCWIGEASVNGYYALGEWAFTFTYRVDWCEDANVVLGVHYRQGSTRLNTFMRDRGVSENWVTPTPSRTVTTKWKQHVENCPLLLPCTWSNYPYVVWHLTADPFGTDWSERGIEG